MKYPQIDVRELCQALGVEYDFAKSTLFYLMLVKEYRFRYEAAQQSAQADSAVCTCKVSMPSPDFTIPTCRFCGKPQPLTRSVLQPLSKGENHGTNVLAQL